MTTAREQALALRCHCGLVSVGVWIGTTDNDGKVYFATSDQLGAVGYEHHTRTVCYGPRRFPAGSRVPKGARWK